MTRYFTMHPQNPQPRLIQQATSALEAGELIAYPTDTNYAFGCALTARQALATIRRLRGLEENHPLTLICESISQVSQFCFLSDSVYRILKNYTPGPYTFILPATKQVPRLALGVKRKVVGIRIPQSPIALALVHSLQNPLLSATLWIRHADAPINDPREIITKTNGQVDLILDAGISNNLPSTVIDLIGSKPVIIRRGLGDTGPFEE